MKRLVCSLMFILASLPLQAQWVQTNGPYGGDVQCFAVSSTNLLAGTRGGGVFLSRNVGGICKIKSTEEGACHVQFN